MIRKDIWPCDVFRYIRYIPSWALPLPLRGSEICEKNDHRDRTRSSSILWKVTWSDPAWGWAIRTCTDGISRGECGSRRWARYIRSYSCTLTWSPRLRLWPASSHRDTPRTFSYSRDRSNRRIWDGEVEEQPASQEWKMKYEKWIIWNQHFESWILHFESFSSSSTSSPTPSCGSTNWSRSISGGGYPSGHSGSSPVSEACMVSGSGCRLPSIIRQEKRYSVWEYQL